MFSYKQENPTISLRLFTLMSTGHQTIIVTPMLRYGDDQKTQRVVDGIRTH